MSATVRLPGPLREYAGGRATVEIDEPAATVRDLLHALQQRHPAVYDRIVTEQGDVRPHINIFVGNDEIRLERGLDTKVPAGAEVTVLPAVSGGLQGDLVLPAPATALFPYMAFHPA